MSAREVNETEEGVGCCRGPALVRIGPPRAGRRAGIKIPDTGDISGAVARRVRVGHRGRQTGAHPVQHEERGRHQTDLNMSHTIPPGGEDADPPSEKKTLPFVYQYCTTPFIPPTIHSPPTAPS